MRKSLKYGLMVVGSAMMTAWLAVAIVNEEYRTADMMATQWVWFYGGMWVFALYAMVMYLFCPLTWQRFLSKAVVWLLMLFGGYEAILGLMQVYGYATSNHSLYELTGTFYNPGPYSGFLAMICPLALHEYLEHNSLRDGNSYRHTIHSYLALGIWLLCLCVLPAGMSRTAWLAAAAGCLLVAAAHYKIGKKIIHYFRTQRLRAWLMTAAVVGMLAAAGCGAFLLKQDSANGRLFLWKISWRALMENPSGYVGEFPKIYGQAQEAYFAEGNYSEAEVQVAGSPEYAFNEYLQFALRQGWVATLIVLFAIVLFVFMGWIDRKYGVCGAILSLAIFAFASYPSQFPLFLTAGFLLLLACIPYENILNGALSRNIGVMVTISLIFGGYINYPVWKKRAAAVDQWKNVEILYHTKAYKAAVPAYRQLEPDMCWNGRFLFEYGHSLFKSGDYAEAINVLGDAERYSCDPMILIVRGRCFQEWGILSMAEEYYKRAINRLPSRMYPYYLLAKLYAEPRYYLPGKMREYARKVIEMEPKVPSPATEEMKSEMRKLLTDCSGCTSPMLSFFRIWKTKEK